MKTKVSPSVVGAFVIGAFALGIIALLAFGGVNFFSKPQRFVVYFDESVHGLEQGSPVKLGGVRVGRVVALNIRYDEKANRSATAVTCELNRDTMTDFRGVNIDVSNRDQLQGLVDRGLRAQLSVAGLATGLLYVELDFLNPRQFPAPIRPEANRLVVVPAVPSAIAGFQASLTEIMTNLKNIDFAGLSRGLTALMADVRTRLDALDLKGTVDQWKRTGAQIENLAKGDEFKRTLENLNQAVADLRGTIARIDGQVEPTGKELRETLAEAKRTIASFNTTAATAQKFLSRNAAVGDELGTTLQHLNEAAESVKRLADFLERNPNALLTGKKPPE
ncbi:MlaD family protein [Opitutus sp. ER46]|uniref:MlaD family protein n=1 Tax=Opitutus sp. ER46 TaxID=2161864 RepID=UPI000D2FE880|nr:MlaD family protein [Opitutus sp. ER46]PTX97887.1 mammalian cell entry protein [Opitutus sp. ER46]